MLKKLLFNTINKDKNLFDGLWSRNSLATGSDVSNSNCISTDSYIPIKLNKNYEIGINVKGGWSLQIYLNVVLYDKDKNFLEKTQLYRVYQGTIGNYTITNENAKYMRFYLVSAYSLAATELSTDSYVKEV